MYSYVTLGRGALLVKEKIGGGFHKVANCKNDLAARDLAEAMNKMDAADQTLSDLVALVKELGCGSQDPVAAFLIERGLLKVEGDDK